MIDQERRDQLLQATRAAQMKCAEAQALLVGREGKPPRPGEVFSAEFVSDVAVELVVLRQDSRNPKRLLVVPADTSTLIGIGDVVVPSSAGSGPLNLHCKYGFWTKANFFKLYRRSGILDSEHLDTARNRLNEMMEGTMKSADLDLDLDDGHPYYQELMEEILLHTAELIGRKSLVERFALRLREIGSTMASFFILSVLALKDRLRIPPRRSIALDTLFPSGPSFSIAQTGMAPHRGLGLSATTGFIAWPIMVCIAVYCILKLSSQPSPIAYLGVATGFSVLVTGGLVCGVAVSLVASTAGGVPLGLVLGVGYAWLLSEAPDLSTFLLKYNNGQITDFLLAGMAALEQPPLWFVAAFTLALSMLSYSMGDSSDAPERLPIIVRVRAIIAGMMIGGAPIGLAMGLITLAATLVSIGKATVLVVGTICGAGYAAGIVIRTKNFRRGVLLGAFYGLTLASIMILGFYTLRHSFFGMIVGTVAHVMFHGTFFVLAFAVAERYGGKWSGAWACALEGVLGYNGFLIYKYPQIFVSW